MSKNVTEHDLADLVEGRLSGERVAIVRAAVERDPALRRALVAMAGDREAMRRLARLDEESADPSIVEAALADAERRALFGEPNPRLAARIGPGRKRHYAAAAALLVFVGLAAVASTLLATRGPRGLALLGSGGDGDSTPGRMDTSGVEDAKAAMARRPPGRLPGDMGVDSRSSLNPPAQETPIEGPPVSSPTLTELAEGWAREAQQKMAAEPMPGAAADAVRQPASLAGVETTTGLTMDQAVALAFEGRLKIVCEGSDAGAVLHRIGRSPGVVAMGPAMRDQARSRGGMSPTDDLKESANQESATGGAGLRVEVRTPLDPSFAALRDRLAALLASASPQGGPPAYFTDAGEGLSAGDGLAPSRDVEDVLWWALPPSAWKPRASVVVTLEIRRPGD